MPGEATDWAWIYLTGPPTYLTSWAEEGRVAVGFLDSPPQPLQGSLHSQEGYADPSHWAPAPPLLWAFVGDLGPEMGPLPLGRWVRSEGCRGWSWLGQQEQWAG